MKSLSGISEIRTRARPELRDLIVEELQATDSPKALAVVRNFV